VTVKLTEAQRKALEIVRDNGPIIPSFFARLMWPESPSWKRYSNVGRGATCGVGVVRGAGGYLGRLYRRGWVRQTYYLQTIVPRGYVLTETGKQALDQDERDPS